MQLWISLILLTSCSMPPIHTDCSIDAMPLDGTPTGCDVGQWSISWACEAGCIVDSPLQYRDVVTITPTTIELTRTSCGNGCPPHAGVRDGCDGSIEWTVNDYMVKASSDYTLEYTGYPGPFNLVRRWRFTLESQWN